MRTADEIRAEIERLQPAYKNACMIKHRDPRIELKATIAALTWVLSDPAPIYKPFETKAFEMAANTIKAREERTKPPTWTDIGETE